MKLSRAAFARIPFRVFFPCLWAVVALPAASCAQTLVSPTEDPRFAQALDLFEAWLDGWMAYEKVPGVSVGLVRDQDLLWADGYGYAHPESQVPADASTVYSICSISKLFTSIGVMQQRDEGKLRLDDAVSSLLDQYQVEQRFPDRGPVTVEGILTHSAGLPRESAHPYWTGPEYPFPTREEVVLGLASQETLYPPSRTFQYSNLGMTLAGQLVEAASGEEYDAYVRSRILEPLGMTSTFTDIPEEHRSGLLATGYTRVMRSGERRIEEFFQAKGIAPAAGFASSVEDLARFASWQFRLLEAGGFEVLDSNTLREMHRVHWVDPDFETHWGLGFAVSNREGRAVGHGGSCPGFRSTFQMWPDQELAVIVLINAQGVNPGSVLTNVSETLGKALKEIGGDSDAGFRRNAGLREYEGLYESTWGETRVIRWGESLAAVSLPSQNAVRSMTKLTRSPSDPDVFFRARDDGLQGEAYVFHRADGAVDRFSVHGNFSRRVR